MRQKKVLEELAERPEAEYDYGTFVERFQVSYNTARADLGRLEEFGLLERYDRSAPKAFRAPDGYLGMLGAWPARTAK